MDIVEVFTRFGAVKSNDWDGPCIAIDLESTEKKAVQCIFETNKIRYKGQELRVKFKDGAEEDKSEFHELYEVEFSVSGDRSTGMVSKIAFDPGDQGAQRAPDVEAGLAGDESQSG